ncbi:MAG: hypothetical protein ACI4ST_05375 [Candidatus Gallimonas sp.]
MKKPIGAAEGAAKRYPFKFTPAMIAVFCLGLALCAACFALTTWQFVGFLQSGDLSSPYEWIKYILLYFVSVFLAVLILAMLIRSEYVITDKFLITRFGVIRSRYEIKKIFSVCLVSGTNKLNVYFDDFKTKYMTIVVKSAWYDDFIRTLCEKNERIEFDFASVENGKNKK